MVLGGPSLSLAAHINICGASKYKTFCGQRGSGFLFQQLNADENMGGVGGFGNKSWRIVKQKTKNIISCTSKLFGYSCWPRLWQPKLKTNSSEELN